MTNYIPIDKLIAEIDRMRNINKKAFMAKHITADVFHGRTQAINHLFDFIISLQQEQSIIEEDWVEKRKQECGHRRLLTNGIYQCERYEGAFVPCDGRCSWVVDYPKLKELEEREQLEVDLDKEVQRWKNKHGVVGMDDLWLKFARHFYKFRLNTKK